MTDRSPRSEVGILQWNEMWVCHSCQMIGSEPQARAHHIVKGHEIEPLTKETATAIWEEWERTGDPRAAR